MRVGCTPLRVAAAEGGRLQPAHVDRDFSPPLIRSGNGRAWFPPTERVLGETARVLTARSGWCAGEEGARRHRLADCPPGGPVCATGSRG